MAMSKRDQHIGIPQRVFSQPLSGIGEIGGNRGDPLFAADLNGLFQLFEFGFYQWLQLD